MADLTERSGELVQLLVVDFQPKITENCQLTRLVLNPALPCAVLNFEKVCEQPLSIFASHRGHDLLLHTIRENDLDEQLAGHVESQC